MAGSLSVLSLGGSLGCTDRIVVTDFQIKASTMLNGKMIGRNLVT
jgi:hypothetical protein